RAIDRFGIAILYKGKFTLNVIAIALACAVFSFVSYRMIRSGFFIASPIVDTESWGYFIFSNLKRLLVAGTNAQVVYLFVNLFILTRAINNSQHIEHLGTIPGWPEPLLDTWFRASLAGAIVTWVVHRLVLIASGSSALFA